MQSVNTYTRCCRLSDCHALYPAGGVPLVAVLGIEPRLTAYETGVFPLDDTAVERMAGLEPAVPRLLLGRQAGIQLPIIRIEA